MLKSLPVDSHLLPQDTAGSERYEAMSRIYYRGARAAVVCYGKPRRRVQLLSALLRRFQYVEFELLLVSVLRSDGQQQLPASSLLGEGAAELRGGEASVRDMNPAQSERRGKLTFVL